MTRVFGGKSLPYENMAQMTIAAAANDLGPSAVSIFYSAHRPLDFIVKTRPSASRREFVCAAIQGRFALPAMVRTRLIEVVVFTTVRCLGSFVQDDVGFFWSEWFHGFHKTGYSARFVGLPNPWIVSQFP